MTKGKHKRQLKYTLAWSSIIIFCIGAIGIMAIFGYKPSPQPDVSTQHAWTTSISMDHNKYGDYLVGFVAQRRQDYNQMSQAFESALIADSDNKKLKITVYMLKALRGQIDDILPLATDLSSLKQGELMTDYVLVAHAFHNELYDQVIQILDNKVKFGADKILKPTLKAWAYAGKNNQKAAEKELEKLNQPASRALYKYYRALMAIYFNDVKTANTFFREISDDEKQNYPSLTYIVFMRDFYRQQGQWKEGFPPYDRLMTFVNNTPSVKSVIDSIPATNTITPTFGAAIGFYDVSVALAPLKLQESSLLLNELALYLKPDSIVAKIWGGELLETAGNYRSANRMYDRIPDQNDVIVLKKVMNFLTMEDYKSAQPYIAVLADHNKADPYIHMLSAQVSLGLKDTKSAIDSFEKATKLFQKNNIPTERGKALFALGAAYEQDGQFEKAEKALLEAIRLIPNDAQALNYLGYMWLDNNKNIDQAFEMVKKASELAPEDPNIMDSVALGYYLKKDYETALQFAEKSTDMISYSSVAYAHLGDIYAALGRKREAKYQYKKALDLTADITPKLKTELKRKLALP